MTEFPAKLIRADLRDFAGYSSARTSAPGTGGKPASHDGVQPTTIWLNANESAAPSVADPQGLVRRYPDPQPPALVEALAAHYAVPADTVVVGRGSDEAIELIVRATCRPGSDGIVISSPTFGMYAVSARLHGVPTYDVPQVENDAWTTDLDAIATTARTSGARVVFVATPGNPTGSVLDTEELARLAGALADDAVVVVDEAYQEFTDAASAITLLPQHPNLVVLRTLSKAHALAGARVGVAIAHPELSAVLRRVQAPYPVPVPVAELALQALAPPALAATARRVAQTIEQRDRLFGLLGASGLVDRVHGSAANFVLARCTDDAATDRLLTTLSACGIVVRDLRRSPGLAGAVRVTAGSAAEVDAVESALASARPSTPAGSVGDTPR